MRTFKFLRYRCGTRRGVGVGESPDQPMIRSFQRRQRPNPPCGRFHAGGRTNASPEQPQLTRQCREKRRALRAQMQAGTLTREQSRYQMKASTTEHRPTK
jgi:hypothetical protein